MNTSLLIVWRRRRAASRPRYGRLAAALILASAIALAPGLRGEAQTPAPSVPVIHPKAQSVTDYLELTGNAAPVNSVKLVARVEGYLEAQNFPDGAAVKKGDLLFTIQQDQYKAQLIEAQSQVQGAIAARDYATIEVGRYKALVKKEAAAETEVDHWIYERASAEAKLLDAQAQVTLAELNLSYTEVKAPFDGQMGKAQIYPGNLVGAPAQPSELAEIVQLDPIYVVANLSEQDALKIRANLAQQRLTQADVVRVPIEVALQNESDFTRRGTLEYVAPAIDPATGTILLRGKLANPTHDLLPGFFVRIRLPMRRGAQAALLVPDTALQEDQGGRYLLVVNKDSVVEKRYVQLGQMFDGLRAVAAGVTAEDQVVAGELWRATPGTKVTPQPAATAPGTRP